MFYDVPNVHIIYDDNIVALLPLITHNITLLMLPILGAATSNSTRIIYACKIDRFATPNLEKL